MHRIIVKLNSSACFFILWLLCKNKVHRLRSSWAVIRADGPLWKLHELLHRDEKCSDEELRHSVNGVLRMGTAIIELARKEKKEEVR